MIGGYPCEHGDCWKMEREAAGMQKMFDIWIWGGAVNAHCHLFHTYALCTVLGAVTPQVLKTKYKEALVFHFWHLK